MKRAGGSVRKAQPLTDGEFASFLTDAKHLDGDVVWSWDTNHVSMAKFSAVLHWGDRVLDLRGAFNKARGSLSITVLLARDGQHHRIYSLDHGGPGHRNPDLSIVGPLHKHRWTERHGDREAYVPTDITKPATDLEGVWFEFCSEATIEHRGSIRPLPPVQGILT